MGFGRTYQEYGLRNTWVGSFALVAVLLVRADTMSVLECLLPTSF